MAGMRERIQSYCALHGCPNLRARPGSVVRCVEITSHAAELGELDQSQMAMSTLRAALGHAARVAHEGSLVGLLSRGMASAAQP